jgi:hypothetical protein
MAQKKHRQRKNHLPAEVAIKPAPVLPQPSIPPTAIKAGQPVPAASTAVTTTRATPKLAVARAAHKPSETPDLGQVIGRYTRIVANVLGSLQLAVVTLSLFAGVILLGAWLSHAYSDKITQELIYGAWWFHCLLFLLGVNIFFAAAKKMRFATEPVKLPPSTSTTLGGKVREGLDQFWTLLSHYWPWKRHQLGFLITHIGLITIVFGGLLTGLFGTDAQLQLIDTPDPEVHNQVAKEMGRVPQASRAAFYSHVSQIRVVRKDQSKSEVFQGDFSPGPLAWQSHLESSFDALISLLNWMSSPLGHHWSMSLDRGAYLEVLDYLPLAQAENFSEADNDKPGVPAFKLQFTTPRFPMPVNGWMACDIENRVFNRNLPLPILVEVIGRSTPAALVREFLEPPPADQLSSKGVLAVVSGGKRKYIPVDQAVGKGKIELDNGQELKITEYMPRWPAGNPNDLPSNPAVQVELYQGGQQVGTFQVLARFNEMIWDKEHGQPMGQGQVGLPLFWYHAADVRGGRDGIKGVAQFVLGQDGALYYRSYHAGKNGFDLEKSGVADKDNKQAYAVWGAMQWKFRVVKFLPRAVDRETFTPVNIPVGKETMRDKQMYPAVIRCRLTVPGAAGGKPDVQEVWVEEQAGRRLKVGETQYTVEYTYKTIDLGFEVLLDKAETKVDPGTMNPATFSSSVRVFDPKNGIRGKREYITMNQPLQYGGYTFYQSELDSVKTPNARGEEVQVTDVRGRPVNRSGFTVAAHPGLWLEYLGSMMLGLGIFTMFYMKAYFFKPRRRRVENKDDLPPAVLAAAPTAAPEVLAAPVPSVVESPG